IGPLHTDFPHASCLIPGQRTDFGVEYDVLTQIERICDPVEILLVFGRFAERVRIAEIHPEDMCVRPARRVDARAWVAVFVPCPADLWVLLDHSAPNTCTFELQRSIEPAHAGPDNCHGEVL